jgi:hypothetical protein
MVFVILLTYWVLAPRWFRATLNEKWSETDSKSSTICLYRYSVVFDKRYWCFTRALEGLSWRLERSYLIWGGGSLPRAYVRLPSKQVKRIE